MKNPFTPNRPANSANFVGRSAELNQCIKSFHSLLNGTPQHLLIRGDRWLGKTSTLFHIKETINDEFSEVFINGREPVFILATLGNCKTLEEMCFTVLKEIHRNTPEIFKKIFTDILGKVKGISVLGSGIDFDWSTGAEKNLVQSFPEMISDFAKSINAQGRCLIIAFDETDEICKIQNTASTIKSFVEYLDKENSKNVVLMFSSTPESYNSLIKQHNSFGRNWRVIDITLMTETEVEELLKKTTKLGDPRKIFSNSAISKITRLSGGYPGVVHEIGYCAYEIDKDNNVDVADVKLCLRGNKDTKGVVETIEDQHFPLYSKLSSGHKMILESMAIYASGSVNQISERESIDLAKVQTMFSSLLEDGFIRKDPVYPDNYQLFSPLLGTFLFLRSNLIDEDD